MATFTQWNRKRPLKRIAYVCGAEPVLVREVLQAYRDAAPGQGVTLFAGSAPERDIWDLLLSYPPVGGRRAFIYQADKLRRISGFEALAAAEGMDTAYAVFISADPDFPRTGEDGKGDLTPALAVLQDSRHAQLIRCCAPSKDEDAVQLVATWWPGAGANFAFDVLARCGGSLQAAYDACEKARLAGLPPGAAALSVCIAPPDDSLADRLIAGDKPRAVQAALTSGHGAVGALIGLLAARLNILEALADAQREGIDTAEAGQRLRIDRFVLRKLAPHAAAYGQARVRRCRELLAVAETAWRGGATEGVAEAIVALW